MAKTERIIGINGLGAQNFMNAMEIFNELGDRPNTRLARCWAAVTIGLYLFLNKLAYISNLNVVSGQSIIEPFTDTVLKSDKEKFGNNRYMASILEWKHSRTPFWYSTDQGDKYVSTTDTNFADTDVSMVFISELKFDNQFSQLENGAKSDKRMSACDVLLMRMSSLKQNI